MPSQGASVLLRGFVPFFLRLGPNTVLTFYLMEHISMMLDGRA